MRSANAATSAPARSRLAAGLAAAVLLAACTTDATPSPVASGGAAPTPTGRPSPTAEATTATSTPEATATPGPTPLPTPGEPPALAVEQVAGGLAAPIGIVGAPDGALFVLEQAGRIVRIGPGGDTSVALDIADRVSGGGERGLLGLALHPGWPETGRAFVDYTDAAGASVLSELATTSDGAAFDPASERVLLRVPQPAGNHNGGQLAFGPDGFLYFGLGDGGGANDQFGNGQDPGTLLGTILRIDVDGGEPYGIPRDNPFVDGGGEPAVFMYGLRNPWRFSFDRATGALWIGDVGQGGWEEIDRLALGEAAGANLGWPVMEGAQCFASADCDPAGLVIPVSEYPTRQVGCAVTGGHVYRGAELGGLFGWYLFADYCSGLLFGLRSDVADGEVSEPQLLLETGLAVSSFGEGADGEQYLADHDGGVYRIVSAP
jgi:glucose/arabinose dehydrogenase